MISDFIETPVSGGKANTKKFKKNAEANFHDDTPNITEVCEDLRKFTKREYRLARKIAKRQRRIDRLYSKINDDTQVIQRLEVLEDGEFKQALKYAETLREADIQRCKAELVQKRAHKARLQAFREAAA